MTNKTASLYRMVTAEGTCPHGLKAKDLLQRQGYLVDDHHLVDREAVDAFKQTHQVKTTPQIFIDDTRIGGYDDLKGHLGVKTKAQDATSYQPVVALFSVAFALAVGVTWLVQGSLFRAQTVVWFISISMVLLGLQKLQDLDKFATMFLNYDLLAKKWVRYGYVYPFVETIAGLMMFMGVLTWMSAPIVLIVAGIGAVSVIKAVYIDKRKLKCACLGDSRVPLGFVSLLENVMMLGMALWMLSTI